MALADGIPACSYELIARMDTDDIAREDRFEKQLSMFMEDSKLDICGSHIIEFENSKENVVAQRKVPLDHDTIKEYQKRRDAFNHMTVMYKKNMVLKAGNFDSFTSRLAFEEDEKAKYYSSFCLIRSDNQGRFQLPKAVYEASKMNKNIEFCPAGDCLIMRNIPVKIDEKNKPEVR